MSLLTNDSVSETLSVVTLAPEITLARSAAEFPSSSLTFVAACSRDWLAGRIETLLATDRAWKRVAVRPKRIGRCVVRIASACWVFLRTMERKIGRKSEFMLVLDEGSVLGDSVYIDTIMTSLSNLSHDTFKVDSEEGDTIQSLSLGRKAIDRREAPMELVRDVGG